MSFLIHLPMIIRRIATDTTTGIAIPSNPGDPGDGKSMNWKGNNIIHKFGSIINFVSLSWKL